MMRRKNKKILIVSQYYWPETFIINEIAESFIDVGVEVDVLTGIPNYPEGKYYDGYNVFKKRKQEHNGVKIKRVAMLPRGTGKSDKRLIGNYASYFILASLRLLFTNKKQYDSILVYGVSPLFQAIPAGLVKKLSKVPYYIHLADLWPDTLFSHGMTKGKFQKMISNLCSKLYRYSDGVLITSSGFRERLISYGVKDEQIFYVPQWANSVYEVKERVGKLRENLGIHENHKVFMFAGNIGFAQGVDTIIEAFHELNDKTAHIIFVGDGTERAWCEDKCQEYGLDNCHFIGKKPQDAMPDIISEADIMMVTLKDKPNYALTLPGRVQAYLACGKPILASANGETKRVVEDAKCGFVYPAGDVKALCGGFKKMISMRPEELIKLTQNAKRYSIKHFDREVLLKKTQDIVLNK